MPPSRHPLYFPDIELPSTTGKPVNVRRLLGLSVVFIYPYTGRLGYADPERWDEIKGAHGSTPQAIGYKALYAQFRNCGVGVFGLSFQDTEWQQEFATRNRLPYELLSDAKAEVAHHFELETITAGQKSFLKRRTMAIENGQIIHDRRDIPLPENDAGQVLDWVKTR
jgi:peroxiredoxin